MRSQKKWISIVSIMIIITFLISCFIPFFFSFSNAATEQETLNNLNKIQKNINQTKKKIDAMQGQNNADLNAKKAADEEIKQLEKQFDELEKQVKECIQEVDKAQNELNEAQDIYEKQYDSFRERARIMYENGNASYLEVLLGAVSFSDMLSRIELVKGIVNYDATLLKNLVDAKNNIEVKKAALEERKTQLDNKLAQVKAKKQELSAKSATLAKNVESRVKEIEKQKETLEELKKQEQAEREVLSTIRALLRKSGSTAKYTGGKMMWPTVDGSITSLFGMRVHPTLKVKKLHTGIDISVPKGSPVYAAADGVVLSAGWNMAYGYCVIINHGDGITTLYGHNSSLCVSTGQNVKRGDLIAKSGSTGYSTGPHLHFEVDVNGTPVNPMGYLK